MDTKLKHKVLHVSKRYKIIEQIDLPLINSCDTGFWIERTKRVVISKQVARKVLLIDVSDGSLRTSSDWFNDWTKNGTNFPQRMLDADGNFATFSTSSSAIDDICGSLLKT